MYIDTHAHLYVPQFEKDRAAMLQRARDLGVDRFYLPNIDSQSIEAMLALEASEPDCYAMMGLHPCSVKPESWEQELQRVKEWLDKRSFVAVGEIGLDLYWDTSTREIQEAAFRTQVQWAKDKDLPIVIHSREATDEIIAILQELQDDRLKGIFHCFTGTPRQAEKIIEMGFFLGIGGVLTFKNSGLDKTVAQLPLERLVLETDAPYLAPAPHRGKRNESAYVALVAEKMAEVLGVPLGEVARQTCENALRIFGGT